MPATIRLTTRLEPLKVDLIREGTPTPVHLNTGAEVIAMSRGEAHDLAGALLTAAEFAPARQIRRPTSVDEAIAHADI